MKTRAILSLAAPLCIALSVKNAEATTAPAVPPDDSTKVTRNPNAPEKLEGGKALGYGYGKVEDDKEHPIGQNKNEAKPEEKAEKPDKTERPEKPENDKPERTEKPEVDKPEKPKDDKPEKPEDDKPDGPEKPEVDKPEKPEVDKQEGKKPESPTKRGDGCMDGADCELRLFGAPAEYLDPTAESLLDEEFKNAFNDAFEGLADNYQMPACCTHGSDYKEDIDEDTRIKSTLLTLHMVCGVTEDGQARRHLRGRGTTHPWQKTVNSLYTHVTESNPDVSQVQLHCKGRRTYSAPEDVTSEEVPSTAAPAATGP